MKAKLCGQKCITNQEQQFLLRCLPEGGKSTSSGPKPSLLLELDADGAQLVVVACCEVGVVAGPQTADSMFVDV